MDSGVPHIPNLRIVLLGYRVGGKSTVGNLILGKQEFDTSKRTARCVEKEGEASQRKVTLVEAPGWWKGYRMEDTPDRDKREIVLSVSLCPPGPHALLLVVDVTDPLVAEYRNALKQHLELLGEKVWSHTIVVFTKGGWLGNTAMEEYIESDRSGLQWLVEKCGNRYHVLDKYRREDVQVTELLEKIEEMVAGNSGNHFHFDREILQKLEEKKMEDEKRKSMAIQAETYFDKTVNIDVNDVQKECVLGLALI
ncbi:GTPase IMAP family member 7-like [Clupea harengus]|uniref:GTPase IMAP family member 7-like n=1 Tax=Clupea harengus TaxID=7950 RepID=A0A8M1KNY1_CLUHA|nr:GTPase IMAP family member 7-like [Clupea harengus]